VKEGRTRNSNVAYIYGSCCTTHCTPFQACTSTIFSFGTAQSKVAYIYRSCRITHSTRAHQLCSVLALKRFQIQFRSELKTPETRCLANVAIVSPKNPRIYERGRAAARRIIRSCGMLSDITHSRVSRLVTSHIHMCHVA